MTDHDDEHRGNQHGVRAGVFSTWLADVTTADQRANGADVPCGSCTACCTSSQFILIGPDETETLSKIPRELLFAAPGLPRGHVVMGYDDHGHCPMFVDGRCSVYLHRPRTCRHYDCRVFTAAGVELDDNDKALITERTRQWAFDFPTALDRTLQAAVAAAARFLEHNRARLPDGAVPRNPTQLAFLAVKLHDVFLETDPETGELRVAEPPVEVIDAAVLQRGSGGRAEEPGGASPGRRRGSLRSARRSR